LSVRDQSEVITRVDGEEVGRHRLDLLVGHIIVVKLKAIKNLEDIQFAAARSDLKPVGKKHG
jgi:PD-(D/E)XK nuclease superfamily protein